MYREKERRLCSHSITGLKRAFATMLMVAEIMTATPQFGYASTRGVGDMGNTTMQKEKPEVRAQIFTPQGQKEYELRKSAEMHENAFEILKTLHNENATGKEKENAAEALEKMVDFGGSAKFRKFVGDLYTKGLISEETKKEFEDVLKRIGESSGSLIKDGKLITFEDIRNDESLKRDRELPKAMRDLIVFSYLVAAMSAESYHNENNALPYDLSIKYKLTSWGKKDKDKDEKLIGQAQEMYHKIRELYIKRNEVSSSKDVFGPHVNVSEPGNALTQPLLNAGKIRVEYPPDAELKNQDAARKYFGGKTRFPSTELVFNTDDIQDKFIFFLGDTNNIKKGENPFNKIFEDIMKKGKSVDEAVNNNIGSGVTEDIKSIFKTYATAVKNIKDALDKMVYEQTGKTYAQVGLTIESFELADGKIRISFGINTYYFLKGENKKDVKKDVLASGVVEISYNPNSKNELSVMFWSTQDMGSPLEQKTLTYGAEVEYTLKFGRPQLKLEVGYQGGYLANEIRVGNKFGYNLKHLYLEIGNSLSRGKLNVDNILREVGIPKDFRELADKYYNGEIWKLTIGPTFRYSFGKSYIELHPFVQKSWGENLKGTTNFGGSASAGFTSDTLGTTFSVGFTYFLPGGK